jgi:CheY-like chemotaxis protein
MNVQRAFKKNNINDPLHVANDGVEALAKLRGEGTDKITPSPRLIILDINMPKMGGLEFLEELRKDNQLRYLTVVILTTSNDERDIKAAYQYNIAGYIVKPVCFEEFVKTIKVLNDYLSLCEW